jgi:hypothetical protein
MTTENSFCLIELAQLSWPPALEIPSRRFRLLVVADTIEISTDIISQFAYAALKSGMVYFCAWGPGCERFHDIVDEVRVKDELGERVFVGPNPEDTIMTTWHPDDTLEEAVEYFINWAHPTHGFAEGSDCWMAICVNNKEWAATIRQKFEEANRHAQ